MDLDILKQYSGQVNNRATKNTSISPLSNRSNQILNLVGPAIDLASSIKNSMTDFNINTYNEMLYEQSIKPDKDKSYFSSIEMDEEETKAELLKLEVDQERLDTLLPSAEGAPKDIAQTIVDNNNRINELKAFSAQENPERYRGFESKANKYKDEILRGLSGKKRKEAEKQMQQLDFEYKKVLDQKEIVYLQEMGKRVAVATETQLLRTNKYTMAHQTIEKSYKEGIYTFPESEARHQRADIIQDVDLMKIMAGKYMDPEYDNGNPLPLGAAINKVKEDYNNKTLVTTPNRGLVTQEGWNAAADNLKQQIVDKQVNDRNDQKEKTQKSVDRTIGSLQSFVNTGDQGDYNKTKLAVEGYIAGNENGTLNPKDTEGIVSAFLGIQSKLRSDALKSEDEKQKDIKTAPLVLAEAYNLAANRNLSPSNKVVELDKLDMIYEDYEKVMGTIIDPRPEMDEINDIYTKLYSDQKASDKQRLALAEVFRPLVSQDGRDYSPDQLEKIKRDMLTFSAKEMIAFSKEPIKKVFSTDTKEELFEDISNPNFFGTYGNQDLNMEKIAIASDTIFFVGEGEEATMTEDSIKMIGIGTLKQNELRTGFSKGFSGTDAFGNSLQVLNGGKLVTIGEGINKREVLSVAVLEAKQDAKGNPYWDQVAKDGDQIYAYYEKDAYGDPSIQFVRTSEKDGNFYSDTSLAMEITLIGEDLNEFNELNIVPEDRMESMTKLLGDSMFKSLPLSAAIIENGYKNSNNPLQLTREEQKAHDPYYDPDKTIELIDGNAIDERRMPDAVKRAKGYLLYVESIKDAKTTMQKKFFTKLINDQYPNYTVEKATKIIANNPEKEGL